MWTFIVPLICISLTFPYNPGYMEEVIKFTTINTNKKALFDYEVLSSYEAGIILEGHEVKSVRAKHVNLKWAYVSLISGKATLIGCHISPYEHMGNKKAIDPTRPREVLIHKKDKEYLASKQKEKGNSIVPLEIYLKWSLAKVRIALVKGRKQYEKKQVLKERDLDREAKSAMKHY